MATLITRTWKSTGPTGHKVKRVAHGYTLMVEGKQERVTKAYWTKDDAREALAKRILERDTPKQPLAPLTLGQAAARYLTAKARKRSLADDARYLDASPSALRHPWPKSPGRALARGEKRDWRP
jgi:hypothetical protein